MDPVSFSRCFVAAVTLESAARNCTATIAARWFDESALVEYLLKGLAALSTPGTFVMAVTIRPIAAFSAGSSTRCPAGATSTACALPPAACGKTASRRSSAACDSVPGDREAVGELAAEPESGDGEHEQQPHPRADDAPRVPVREAAQAVQERGHGAVPSSRGVGCDGGVARMWSGGGG